MFRIRRIHDDILPVNQAAIREVEQIFASHFPLAPEGEIDKLREQFHNPFQSQFRPVLYVAENGRGRINGFAIVYHDPILAFTYLDFIASSKWTAGRGVGAALYEHVRDEALTSGAKAMFFECLPDDPQHCPDELVRRQNAARLRFYERYGVRPIVGTAYELTSYPGGPATNLPFLMYDDLDQNRPLHVEFARPAVRAIMERKYAHLYPPELIDQVAESFRDDPLKLRDYRYVRPKTAHKTAVRRLAEPIAMTINDKHDIHHIRERGYVESPVRIRAILSELVASGLTEIIPVKEYPLDPIIEVHAPDLVRYLEAACAHAPKGKSVYPYVFPIRNPARPPKDLSVQAGYYCIDTFTPLNQNAFPAAKRGVDCALTAADEILNGRRLAYALVRPPGHHAEHRAFGGFCYFNNAAVAAQRLCRAGKVAILDVDYHHGNGQQDIFYRRSDVLTISIHGDPEFAYPYFTGFADEIGEGPGEGYNLNIVLPENVDGDRYRVALAQALDAIRAFEPAHLVVALGLDPAKGDPTGTWSLRGRDFEANGRMIGGLHLPTLIVQEGGYRTRTLGLNARHFFHGLAAGAYRER